MKNLVRSLSCLLLVSFLFSFIGKVNDDAFAVNRGYPWEEYDSSLARQLRSIDDLIAYADANEGADQRGSLAYCNFLAATISKRFYHSYSYYSFCDNWIASLAGRLFWEDLSAIVVPDDIMKHPMAACSQVSLVLKECFARTDVTCRKVGLLHHFVLEAMINNRWYLYDPNLEPNFINGRKSLEELKQDHELYPAYAGHIPEEKMIAVFAHPSYNATNVPLAAHAIFFQQLTCILSLVSLFGLLFYVFVALTR